MSTALVKGKLKAAREAIQAKDYGKAEKAASDALTFESTNYNARVFLAVAKLNLGKLDESEQEYRKAIDAQPETPLAWQGLASFYERTERWELYIDTQRRLADLAAKRNDATKVAEALQKILVTQREHGSKHDALEALKLFLPDSPYYFTLSSLPPPDQTNPTATTTFEAQSLIHNSLPILEQIVHTTESEEQSAIDAEVNKRRQRLTTTTSMEDTRKAVMREIMSRSQLPDLYEQLLSHHMAGDDLRRSTESKLLQYQYDLLLSWPDPFIGPPDSAISEEVRSLAERTARISASEKDRLRAKLLEIANGMTTLRLPNELAWAIVLEWRDMQSPSDYDEYQLKRYTDIFPKASLTRLAVAVLELPDPLLEDEKEKREMTIDERAEIVDTIFEDSSKLSLKAHVMAASFYLAQKDYDLTVDIAEAGLGLLTTLEGQIGQKLPGISFVLNQHLAIALVHLDPPSHHVRALRLLEPLLRQSPDNLECLMAKAYIYQRSERWQDAFDLFNRVYSITWDDALKFEALKEESWSLGNIEGRADEALDELHEVAIIMDPKAHFERQEKAQAWWRYGTVLLKSQNADKQQQAYDAFVESIKRDNVYAPAFSALGRYFMYALDPPDKVHAVQCFQKAFELDDKEHDAARVLASEYAESDDWDLVEVVARRVVANVARTAKRGATTDAMSSGSYTAKKLAWAWKAIGAADLKARRYTEAMVALQSALRGVNDDPNIWLQLAVAYRGGGKHVAALKTLVCVLQIDADNWHAKYLIADIQRQLGIYQASIEAFEALHESMPDEIAITVALAETYLSLGLQQARNGFSQRCASSLLQSLSVCLDILATGQAARIVWKLIADALLALAKHASEESAAEVMQLCVEILEHIRKDDIDSKNPLVTAVTCARLSDEKARSLPPAALCSGVAVLAYSLRVLLEGQSGSGRGSAWYDLGQALHQLRPSYASLRLSNQSDNDMAMQCIQCLRNALQREPLNGAFWNLLGVLSMSTSNKLAQHSFIRAVELNVRSAVPWTNLGLFYLRNEDIQLANKAFLRAQVLDPEYPQAWLGQAALARVNGQHEQARSLTAHAAMLSNGSVPQADLAFAYESLALAEYDPMDVNAAVAALSQPRFLAARYCETDSGSATAAHLHGLLSERLGDYTAAVASFSKAVKILEAEYEITESPEIERQYIIANVSLARASLATGGDDTAIEHIGNAQSLVDLAGDGDNDAGLLHLNIQCHLIRALAAYWQHDYDTSRDNFTQAQAILSKNQAMLGQAGVNCRNLLSNVTLAAAGSLYARKDAANREQAEQLLLQEIYDEVTELPRVTIVAALSALAIAESNDELLDAALLEVEKLPIDARTSADPSGDISYLLRAHALLQGKGREEALKSYDQALHAVPTSNAAAAHVFANDGEGGDSAMSHKLHAEPWKFPSSGSQSSPWQSLLDDAT